MALTALQNQRMQRVGLAEFLDKNHDYYKATAQVAYNFTATILGPSGQRVRQDDVFGHLKPGIELDDRLSAFTSMKGLSAQFWTTWFTYLVLDVLWEELENEHEAGGDRSEAVSGDDH